ncbi:protein-L-isoaspartate O-methyltransferase [Pyronema omphalodes]|nr:protein-L-isoaspartate O-methyltransferase [Pyronema omphalodes]
MSWRCTGKTNAELIANLKRHGLIKTESVLKAMESIDRAHYCPFEPYVDGPQHIGFDATISAPHMHASAVEALAPFLKPGAKVLDVGSGSGYLCAVFGEMVKPNGLVIGIEHIPQLVALSLTNLQKAPHTSSILSTSPSSTIPSPSSTVIQILQSDGRLGHKESAPYDAIHVGAAAKGFPEELIQQLKAPGRMFIPVEEQDGRDQYGQPPQYIYVVDKDKDGKVTKTRKEGVMYVPLTDRKEFREKEDWPGMGIL